MTSTITTDMMKGAAVTAGVLIALFVIGLVLGLIKKV